jgi:hypothetical protein
MGITLSAATVFSVFRYTIASSDNDYLYTFGRATRSGSQMTLARRSDRVYHFDGSKENFPPTTCLPPNEFQVFTQVYGNGTSASQETYENGNLYLSTQAANPYSVDTNTAVLGNWSSGAFRFVGDLVQLLVYDRVLAAPERVEVEQYLRARIQETDSCPLLDLRNSTVVQYEFGAQDDAQWVVCAGGRRVNQLVNADASILLTDLQSGNTKVRGILGSGSAPDYMGFVFGYQGRGNYYLFDWRKTSATFFGWPVGNQGMSLRVVDVRDGEDPHGADLWGSVDTANVRTLRDNDIPWVDGVDYEFELRFVPGHIEITILGDDGNVIESWAVDDSRYVSGRFGYYINSLQDVRFGSVCAADIPPSSTTSTTPTLPPSTTTTTSSTTSTTLSHPFCGNGVRDPGEDCDPGTSNLAACCTSACSFAPTAIICRPAAGPCDAAETCSGTGPTCPPDRQRPLVCGDGRVCGTEECDPPGGTCGDTSLCDPSCQCVGVSCPTLTVGTVVTYGDGRVRVPVDLDPMGLPVAALNYTVEYRDGFAQGLVTLAACEPGESSETVNAEQSCETAEPPGETVVFLTTPSVVPVPALPAGSITALVFDVTGGRPGETIDVCIPPASVAFGGTDGKALCVGQPVCGALEVVGCGRQGDCNCDGAVNSGDRVCLITKFFDPTLQGSCACEDCNLDGQLNAADAPCITLCRFGRCPAVDSF